MSTEAESPPPRGGTAILAPAAPASARAQTAVIGAAAAAGIAAGFIPRAAPRRPLPRRRRPSAPPRWRRNRPGLAPDDPEGSDRRVRIA